MRCARCPLFHTSETGHSTEDSCAIFGDSWNSQFQYEDKDLSMIVGCYIEKAYIDKFYAAISEANKYKPFER